MLRPTCCVLGFFVYLDQHGVVCGVSSLSRGDGLFFNGPFKLWTLRVPLRQHLYDARRVMPVTMRHLAQRGAQGAARANAGSAALAPAPPPASSSMIRVLSRSALEVVSAALSAIFARRGAVGSERPFSSSCTGSLAVVSAEGEALTARMYVGYWRF